MEIKRGPWSQLETQIIIEKHEKHTAAELAKELGRSVSGIQKRMKQLGLLEKIDAEYWYIIKYKYGSKTNETRKFKADSEKHAMKRFNDMSVYYFKSTENDFGGVKILEIISLDENRKKMQPTGGENIIKEDEKTKSIVNTNLINDELHELPKEPVEKVDKAFMAKEEKEMTHVDTETNIALTELPEIGEIYYPGLFIHGTGIRKKEITYLDIKAEGSSINYSSNRQISIISDDKIINLDERMTEKLFRFVSMLNETSIPTIRSKQE